MSVKIRLRRQGRKARPFYHIIVADSRSKRDGKFIDTIGTYNPLTIPATIEVDVDKAFKWVMNGAQPTDTVRRILGFKGVMYKKHLQRGVQKGAFSQEEADNMFADWVENKAKKIQDRIEKELHKIEQHRTKRNEEEATKRSAKIVAKEAAAAPAEEVSEETAVEEMTEDTSAEEATENTANEAEAPAAEETQAEAEGTEETPEA